MKITICDKACSECGFTKSGTKDTLYAQTSFMLNQGTLFPCHLYLKSQTGSENRGTEKLDVVRVCRGYIAYVKKNFPVLVETWRADIQYHWFPLLDQIKHEELSDIYTPNELFNSHIHLREGIYLDNLLGS